MKNKSVEILDLTPTWESIALWLAERATSGDENAKNELLRMARVADAKAQARLSLSKSYHINKSKEQVQAEQAYRMITGQTFRFTARQKLWANKSKNPSRFRTLLIRKITRAIIKKAS